MSSGREAAAGAVLIVAPTGRDAALAAAALEQAGVSSEICSGLADLSSRLTHACSAAVVAEEALTADGVEKLLGWLRQQPAWSDLPLLVLTSGRSSADSSVRILKHFGSAANVTLLERPLGSVTLVSAVQAALRARGRQHEVRDLLAQRETVLASISDAFSALDHEWRYTYVNDRAAEFAGRSKEEMIGRTVWEIYPESLGEEFERRARRARETGQPQQFEAFFSRWALWLETRIYPSGDGVVVLRADITQRKQQEAQLVETDQKLKESEDRLRLATDAAAIGTFDYYPKTRELRLSDRARELLGMSKDETATFERYLAAYHPADRHLARETAHKVREPDSGGRYAQEYRTIARADQKERWIAEKGRVVLDENGEAIRFVGTLLDITDRKIAELASEHAKQQAEEANRAKDQFLAMLSHELRTPLTPVLMTLASLRRQPDLTDELRRDLEVLQRNVELEALLIDDLLDLTRIVHGKLELHNDAVDIHSTLEHALNICAFDLQEKHLEVARRFHAVEHHCWADAARVQQVFWNLVKNAVKFTQPRGHITISTRNDDARNVVVEIVDDGVGISGELLPRIFDAFEQGGRAVTNQYGGLGLGLAISKRVVDLHGGTISAESAGHGKGARFVVTLKAMETSLLEGPTVFLPEEGTVSQPAAILLVEDHEDTARVLRRVLEHAGYSVAHASTIAAARELAGRESFDLLISDLGLPDGSGVELMNHLRASQGIAGIALSGFGTDDDLAASAAAGFAEHLIKPIDWPQLRNAIDRLLAGRGKAAAALTQSSSGSSFPASARST